MRVNALLTPVRHHFIFRFQYNISVFNNNIISLIQRFFSVTEFRTSDNSFPFFIPTERKLLNLTVECVAILKLTVLISIECHRKKPRCGTVAENTVFLYSVTVDIGIGLVDISDRISITFKICPIRHTRNRFPVCFIFVFGNLR